MAISLTSPVSGNLTALQPNVYYVAQWTSYDKSGVLWIVLVTGLTYIASSVGIRYTSRRGAFSTDDWMLCASAAFALLQNICVFIALRHGFGRDSERVSTERTAVVEKVWPSSKHSGYGSNNRSQAIYASLVLLVLAHGLAKLSVLLLLRRIFTATVAAAGVFYTLLGAVVGWIVLSILLLLAKCPPAWLFSDVDTCPGLVRALSALSAAPANICVQIARHSVICVLDMTTEIVLVLLLTVLAQKYLLKTQQKLLVISSFASRLPIIMFLGLFLSKSHQVLKSDNRTLTYLTPLAWLQVAMVWSLVTASIPSLRSILQPFRIAERIQSRPGKNGLQAIVVSRELGVTWDS